MHPMASKKSNKRYSKYHPDRPCSKCILCGTFKSSAYYSHYVAWGEDEKHFILQHLDFQPDPSSCICIAHLKEAQCTHAQGYIPTWRRSLQPVKSSVKIQHCIYPSCSSNSKLITPSFASSEDLEAVLQVQSSEEHPLILCPKHYHELYHHFHTSLPCASCGVQPKAGTCFTRHSPNANLVNELLRQCTELEDTDMISDEDYVCSSCYKSHLALVKSHVEQGNSSDMHLNDLIAIWEFKLSDSTTDKLTRTVLHTAIFVARELLNQRAVLLPHVSRVFLHTYGQSTSDSNEQILEGREGTIKFSSRWLLKQLIMHLCNHMDYKCVHKKFGTVLFRKGGDMLLSLSWVLGRGATESESLYECKSGQSNTMENTAGILIKAGDILNDLIHKEIRKISDEGLVTPPILILIRR